MILLRRLLLLLLLAAPFAHAQGRDSALSDREIEDLREKAITPPERVLAFVDFINVRIQSIEKVSTGRRHAGREQDIHDAMEQISSIAEDLSDNLDDYSKRHQDVRKALPKLIAAVERWQTAIKTPPDDDTYKLARSITLDALGDVRESATRLLDDQKAYFLAHPPTKSSQDPREAPARQQSSPF